jgi:hypothetical protein
MRLTIRSVLTRRPPPVFSALRINRPSAGPVPNSKSKNISVGPRFHMAPNGAKDNSQRLSSRWTTESATLRARPLSSPQRGEARSRENAQGICLHHSSFVLHPSSDHHVFRTANANKCAHLQPPACAHCPQLITPQRFTSLALLKLASLLRFSFSPPLSFTPTTASPSVRPTDH